MFQSDFKESKENVMEMKNHSCEAVQGFLNFIYTGKVPEADTNLMEFFDLTSLYDLKDAKYYCEAKLIQTLTPESSFELLKFANLHGFLDLKMESLKQMRKYFDFDEKLRSYR